MNPVLFNVTKRCFVPGAVCTRGIAMLRHPLFFGLAVKLYKLGRASCFLPKALLLVTLFAVPASGQEWAEKMFSVTSHNFGTVAKGSKTEFRFIYRNLYEEDVHVSSVRTSCGCTQPAITKS